MSEDVRIRIVLDHGTTLAAGAAVSGVVVVEAPVPRRCDAVLVRLYWRVNGEQDETDVTHVHAEESFARFEELTGERRFPFRLRLPYGPLTFAGKTVQVVQGVAARVRWPGDEPDTATYQVLTVGPAPRPLPAGAGGAGEPPSGSGAPPPLAAARSRDEVLARLSGPGAEAAASVLADIHGVRRKLGDALGTALLVLYLLVLAVVGFGMAAGAVVAAFADPNAGTILLGALVGLPAAFWVVHGLRHGARRARLRIGAGRLGVAFEAGPLAAAFGETASFRCRVRRGAARTAARLTWELRHVQQSARRTKRKNSRGNTVTETRWTTSAIAPVSGELPLPDGAAVAVAWDAALPERGPSTVHFETRRILWECRVWLKDGADSVTDAHPLVVLPFGPPTAAAAADATDATDAADAAPAAAPSETPAPVPISGDRLQPTPAPGATERDALVRRATFALARVRALRRAARAAWRERFLLALPIVVPAALFLAVAELKVVGPWAVILPGLSILTVGAMMAILFLPIVAGAVLWHVAKAVARAPVALLALPLERRIAARLLRDGRVPREWYAGHRLRRWAVERLVREEPGFVLGPDGLRPTADGPPESCPSCGALLGHPGPGIRRCHHCEYERYDAPPARSRELTAAEAAIDQIRAAPVRAEPRTPAAAPHAPVAAPHAQRELFRAFRRSRAPGLGRQVVWGLRGIAFTAVCGLVADLLPGGPDGGLSDGQSTALSIGVLPGFAAACALAHAAYRWTKLRWVEFRPGVRDHDRQLGDEVLRQVAWLGRAPLSELAERLGVSRAHLDAVVAALGRDRRLPLFHDTTSDELVTLYARTHGGSRCGTCGGHTEIVTFGEARCVHCGASSFASAAAGR